MAVTVFDLRTTVSAADNTTGWNTGSAFTSAPSPVEGSACLGFQVSNETLDIFFTSGAVNLSNSLVYIWLFNRSEADTLANGGVGIYLGDGSNGISFHLAGADAAGFRHDVGPAQWNCLLLDGSSLPAQTTVRSGSLGALNMSAITQIGLTFKTLAKSVGGVENCFIDAIRTGTSGLRVTAGTVGAPGLFSEIAATDRSATRAGGVCRELGAGLYGLQGSLTFGAASLSDTYFADTNVSVAFEDRGLSVDKYLLSVANPDFSGTTTFLLGTKVGTGIDASGVDGANLSAPAAAFTADAGTVLGIYGSLLQGFTQGITLASGHEFINSRAVGCGVLDANGATLVNSAILQSVALADTSALRWNVGTDPDTLLHGVQMSKGANAHHAIELGLNSPLTLTLRNMSFSGFNATNGLNDSTLHILRTSGTVTVNLINATGNVSYKTAGATVVLVQNPVTTTLTVRDVSSGGIIEGGRAYLIAAAGGPLAEGTVIFNTLTSASGQVTDTRSLASPQPVTGWVRKASASPLYQTAPISATIDNGSGLSLTVQMIPDE